MWVKKEALTEARAVIEGLTTITVVILSQMHNMRNMHKK